MILGQPMVNPGLPMMGPKPGMMNDGGMAPSLGSLVGPHGGHIQQRAELGMVPGQGGGLMRLMALYGRPGRALGNPYGTAAY